MRRGILNVIDFKVVLPHEEVIVNGSWGAEGHGTHSLIEAFGFGDRNARRYCHSVYRRFPDCSVTEATDGHLGTVVVAQGGTARPENTRKSSM